MTLIEKLRDRANRKWTDAANRSASLFGEAADEIERLHAQVNKLNNVAEAAKDVVAWDWSENDQDCVDDIAKLKIAVDALSP